jgi:hypothetical protein
VMSIHSMAEWRELLAKGELVLVDCYATWCPPCKVNAPLDAMALGYTASGTGLGFRACQTGFTFHLPCVCRVHCQPRRRCFACAGPPPRSRALEPPPCPPSLPPLFAPPRLPPLK